LGGAGGAIGCGGLPLPSRPSPPAGEVGGGGTSRSTRDLRVSRGASTVAESAGSSGGASAFAPPGSAPGSSACGDSLSSWLKSNSSSEVSTNPGWPGGSAGVCGFPLPFVRLGRLDRDSVPRSINEGLIGGWRAASKDAPRDRDAALQSSDDGSRQAGRAV